MYVLIFTHIYTQISSKLYTVYENIKPTDKLLCLCLCRHRQTFFKQDGLCHLLLLKTAALLVICVDSLRSLQCQGAEAFIQEGMDFGHLLNATTATGLRRLLLRTTTGTATHLQSPLLPLPLPRRLQHLHSAPIIVISNMFVCILVLPKTFSIRSFNDKLSAPVAAKHGYTHKDKRLTALLVSLHSKFSSAWFRQVDATEAA